MPRKTKMTTADKIEKTKEKLAELNKKMKSVQKELKALEAQKEMEDTAEILSIIKKSGKSLEELKEFANQK